MAGTKKISPHKDSKKGKKDRGGSGPKKAYRDHK